MESSSQNTLQSYAQALLTLVGNRACAEDNPLFGEAMLLDTGNTIYRQTAHTVLQALIEHSPSPEAVAGQFLADLIKCKIPAVETLVGSLLNDDRSVSPANWAEDVYAGLNKNEGDIDIMPVNSLANFYLTNLIIAIRNPFARTPQDTGPPPPTPDPERTRAIHLLPEKATVRNQATLKELVLRRDGFSCPVTGATFEGDGSVVAHCAHIIPFAVHNKAPVHTAIEMFTGEEVKAECIQEFINNPANAINLEYNAHHSMDKSLAWGIEAKLVENKWKYYFRTVRTPRIPMYVRNFIQDGEEMQLGKGVDGAVINLPDPGICNMHLAVARVFAASGFAEVFDRYHRENGDNTPSLQDELWRRLAFLSV